MQLENSSKHGSLPALPRVSGMPENEQFVDLTGMKPQKHETLPLFDGKQFVTRNNEDLKIQQNTDQASIRQKRYSKKLNNDSGERRHRSSDSRKSSEKDRQTANFTSKKRSEPRRKEIVMDQDSLHSAAAELMSGEWAGWRGEGA